MTAPNTSALHLKEALDRTLDSIHVLRVNKGSKVLLIGDSNDPRGQTLSTQVLVYRTGRWRKIRADRLNVGFGVPDSYSTFRIGGAPWVRIIFGSMQTRENTYNTILVFDSRTLSVLLGAKDLLNADIRRIGDGLVLEVANSKWVGAPKPSGNVLTRRWTFDPKRRTFRAGPWVNMIQR